MPQPKTFGELKNLPLLNTDKPLQTLMKIADELGEIFKFEAPGRVTRYLSSQRLIKEACDESRFDKNLSQALKFVRDFAGDGLFTSWTHEKNWKKAHNILLPSFSQQAMKGYHAMMVDIAVQLIQKWERLNADEHIEVPEDMTRLTLDSEHIDEPRRDRLDDRLHLVGRAKLHEDVVDVKSHRPLRDAEDLTDLACRLAFGGPAQHFAFPRRQHDACRWRELRHHEAAHQRM